ncbi:MAG: sulfatase-like hydrolase/transferase [Candidatus Ornithospirochaeta sp.]|nr:sulfatase-like hydrolase/transferase [Sphaerochaetaceae bacterium]MDY5523116.1 sulfatase-like hydrolase/transferase [Candidatus Ornithospirochaeta sp.]
MEMKNILIFMSDQHSPSFSEFSGGLAKTPTLNEMADNGTVFDAAYTSCPLCVPARMSFMSGRLPSKTGILNNYSILADNIPTIAHAFDAAGYETVLIGRMHFVGENQKHGFQTRLVGDITSPEWKPTKAFNEKNRGPFMKCFDETGCTTIIGGGNSPVQEFDEAVVKAAEEWLSIPHEKPQFIVVGTYAPHFPYVAALDKYRYYLDKVSLPWGFDNPPEYLDPALRIRLDRSSRDPDIALRAQAAYCGMIETTDENIGTVRKAFNAYNASNNQKGLFVYTSDHGDQCGERGLFAKMSFFDSSARIPMFFEGEGIEKGKRIDTPVGLIDLVPTLCSYADVPAPPCIDGEDFLSSTYDKNRPIISEMYGIFGAPGKFPEVEHMNSVSRMVRKGKYKFITRAGFEEYDLLFDMEKDPGEHNNIIKLYPEIADELRTAYMDLPSNEDVRKKMNENWKVYDFMQTAQVPSEELLSQFWIHSSDNAKELPLEK